MGVDPVGTLCANLPKEINAFEIVVPECGANLADQLEVTVLAP